MSGKIGEVEFLVKFDTMDRSFQDSLEKAVVRAGTGVDISSLESDIKLIKDDLLIRLRTPPTGDWLQFRHQYSAMIKYLESAEFKQGAEAALSQSKSVEKFLGNMGDLTKEELIERAANAYSHMIKQMADNPSTFAQLFPKYKTLEGMKMMSEGTHFSQIKEWLKRVLAEEFEVETTYRKMAKDLDEDWVLSPKQRRFSKLLSGVGTGSEEISDPTKVIEVLSKTFGSGELKSLFGLDPGKSADLSDEIKKKANELLEEYMFKEGTRIPNILLNLWGAEHTSAEHGRPDVLLGLTGEMWEDQEIKNFLFGAMEKEHRKEYENRIDEWFEENENLIIPIDLARVGEATAEKLTEKLAKYGLYTIIVSGTGAADVPVSVIPELIKNVEIAGELDKSVSVPIVEHFLTTFGGLLTHFQKDGDSDVKEMLESIGDTLKDLKEMVQDTDTMSSDS